MALIQIKVDNEIKQKADAVFGRSGLTTPQAVKVMVTQVANEGRSPFDNLFSRGVIPDLPEDIRRDMVYAEAQELGLFEDDAEEDPCEIPADTLARLGLSPEEVGQ